MADEREVLLEVKDLEVTYGSGRKAYKAVKNANFTIYKGETFGLVGESGSGKTTIGRAIMRILPTSGGQVFYKGQQINGKISHALDRQVIKEIQMIFQDPQSSLNERAKVSYIVGEGLMNVRPDLSAAERDEKVRQALLDVGLLPEFASRFPHEFSGGQRQRIGIARALIVELADAEELVTHAIHPYTRSLLSAIPMPSPRRERQKKLLGYDPAIHDYSAEAPQWRELRPRHWVLCSAAEAEAWCREL